MKIVIRFDESSKRHDRGDGIIYIDFGNFQFPNDDWFDFIFLVLSDWNAALWEMIKEGNDTCILTMQDGSWALQIVKQPLDCYIEFGEYDVYDESFIKNGEQIIKTNFEEIVREVLNKTKYVSDYASKNALKSDYAITLNNWYDKLKNEVN